MKKNSSAFGTFSAQAGAKTKPKKKAAVGALWSEIKPVFAALLQHGTCAFCERRLGKDELIAYEQDIETLPSEKGCRSVAPGRGYRQDSLPCRSPSNTEVR